MSYDLIYVNGASYEAGAGLCQHEYLTDVELQKYPEWLTNFPKIMTEEKMKELWNLYDNGLEEREKQCAWPAHLSRMTGIPVQNEAVAGASASTTAIKTLETNMKQHKGKKVLYIIGVCPNQGIWWPGSERGNDSILLNPYRKFPNTFERFIAEHIRDNASREQVDHLYNISFKGLYLYLKERKRDCYFVHADFGLADGSSGRARRPITGYLDEIAPNIDPTKDKVLTVCGHYTEDVHIELAERIAKKIESGEI
jgi:hypothetical protein